MKTIVIAKALILDKDGDALIMRRSDTHPTLALKPDLPSGEAESGEEPGVALVREIEEETGLKVSASVLVPLYAGTEVYDGESRLRILYGARLNTKQPKVTISWEHAEANWLNSEEVSAIENDYHPFYRDALRYVHEHNLFADF